MKKLVRISKIPDLSDLNGLPYSFYVDAVKYNWKFEILEGENMLRPEIVIKRKGELFTVFSSIVEYDRQSKLLLI